MNSEKINKVFAYALVVTVLGAFLIALIFGVYKSYFVPKISWSNMTKEQMDIEFADEINQNKYKYLDKEIE